MNKIILISLTYLLILTNAQAAMVVTSLTEFEDLLGDATIINETFSNPIPAAESILLDSGITSTLAGGNIAEAIFFNENSVQQAGQSSFFVGSVDGDGDMSALTLTFDFPDPILGFGAEFTTFFNLDVSIDGGNTFFDIAMEIDPTEPTDFFGLVETTPFTSVQFSVQDSDELEIFNLENLVFTPVSSVSAPEPVSVPVPAVFWFMGFVSLGLLGFSKSTFS